MTEDEAKTKWCPMVRKLAYNGSPDSYVACNRDADGGLATCIASECMWWVWDMDAYDEDTDSMVPVGHCGAIK